MKGRCATQSASVSQRFFLNRKTAVKIRKHHLSEPECETAVRRNLFKMLKNHKGM